MDKEIFKPIFINNEKTKYFITNHGNVYRKYKTCYRKSKPEKNHGYLRVTISHNGKKKHKRIHRLVAEYFIDNPYGYDVVHHIDNDKTNNHYTNLKWVTNKENSMYAKNDGLILNCENHNMAKCTNEDIKFVCTLLESGMYTALEISTITNINISIIYNICSGKHWTPISKYYNISNRKKRMVSNNKIDDRVVKKIKKDIKKGFSNSVIAEKFGIKKYIVNDIRRGKTYKNI
jgi:uncharacterized HNH endonuclease L245